MPLPLLPLLLASGVVALTVSTRRSADDPTQKPPPGKDVPIYGTYGTYGSLPYGGGSLSQSGLMGLALARMGQGAMTPEEFLAQFNNALGGAAAPPVVTPPGVVTQAPPAVVTQPAETEDQEAARRVAEQELAGKRAAEAAARTTAEQDTARFENDIRQIEPTIANNPTGLDLAQLEAVVKVLEERRDPGKIAAAEGLERNAQALMSSGQPAPAFALRTQAQQLRLSAEDPRAERLRAWIPYVRAIANPAMSTEAAAAIDQAAFTNVSDAAYFAWVQASAPLSAGVSTEQLFIWVDGSADNAPRLRGAVGLLAQRVAPVPLTAADVLARGDERRANILPRGARRLMDEYNRWIGNTIVTDFVWARADAQNPGAPNEVPAFEHRVSSLRTFRDELSKRADQGRFWIPSQDWQALETLEENLRSGRSGVESSRRNVETSEAKARSVQARIKDLTERVRLIPEPLRQINGRPAGEVFAELSRQAVEQAGIAARERTQLEGYYRDLAQTSQRLDDLRLRLIEKARLRAVELGTPRVIPGRVDRLNAPVKQDLAPFIPWPRYAALVERVRGQGMTAEANFLGRVLEASAQKVGPLADAAPPPPNDPRIVQARTLLTQLRTNPSGVTEASVRTILADVDRSTEATQLRKWLPFLGAMNTPDPPAQVLTEAEAADAPASTTEPAFRTWINAKGPTLVGRASPEQVLAWVVTAADNAGLTPKQLRNVAGLAAYLVAREQSPVQENGVPTYPPRFAAPISRVPYFDAARVRTAAGKYQARGLVDESTFLLRLADAIAKNIASGPRLGGGVAGIRGLVPFAQIGQIGPMGPIPFPPQAAMGHRRPYGPRSGMPCPPYGYGPQPLLVQQVAGMPRFASPLHAAAYAQMGARMPARMYSRRPW